MLDQWGGVDICNVHMLGCQEVLLLSHLCSIEGSNGGGEEGVLYVSRFIY